ACEALVRPGEEREEWAGVGVLVTAGGTREPVDSVRYIGNRSSGRMGFALAQAAAERGARVTVVAANVALARDPRVTYVDVETSAELENACREAFPDCRVLLMAAAVSDFRPARPEAGKIKRQGRDRLGLELEPTSDVLAALVRERRSDQVVVAFAAEHGGEAIEYARQKLADKGVDAVV